MHFIKFVIAAILFVAIGTIVFVHLAPLTAIRLITYLTRAHADLTRKEIHLPDGYHYVYLEGGKGDPLMLIHGFGAMKDDFTNAAAYLTAHYRVIIPDLIGFGESSHPQDADYTPSAQAARLHMLAGALGIKRLHLGGNSMGGQIALLYAASWPDEVASLWLLDPAGIWSAPPSEYFNRIKETGQNLLLINQKGALDPLIHFVMNKPPFIPRPILRLIEEEKIRNYGLETKIFKQFMDAGSVEDRISGLSTPALIVWGEKDRVLNAASAEILHKLMPHSQVILMPDIGHVPMLEAPRQSAEDYLRFRNAVN